MRTRNRRKRHEVRERMRALLQAVNGRLSRLSPTKGHGERATPPAMQQGMPVRLDDTATISRACIRASGYQ